MSNISPWQRFIARSFKGYDQATVAKKTGVSPATVSRWHNKPSGSAEHVILIARVFGDDPTLALVDTGYLTMEEATRGEVTVEELLERIDELDLAREIVRRLEAGDAGEALAYEAPSNVIVGGFGKNAYPAIPDNVEEVWEGAAHPDSEEPEDHTP